MAHRRQLTLFVEPPENLIIEEIRRRYNPIQFELINCHVTLCREDEIGESEGTQSRYGVHHGEEGANHHNGSHRIAQEPVLGEFITASRLTTGIAAAQDQVRDPFHQPCCGKDGHDLQ